jgi:hypothetical protein
MMFNRPRTRHRDDRLAWAQYFKLRALLEIYGRGGCSRDSSCSHNVGSQHSGVPGPLPQVQGTVGLRDHLVRAQPSSFDTVKASDEAERSGGRAAELAEQNLYLRNDLFNNNPLKRIDGD